MICEEGQQKYHVRYQTFPLKRLREWAEENEYAKRNKEIEDERCEADLLYELFKRPHVAADRLLRGLIELIERKNEPDLERSRMFREARDYVIHHPRCPLLLKQFSILLILSREPDALSVFEAGYKPHHRGCLWGTQCNQHLRTFVQQHLRCMVDGTMSCAFGESNIVLIVRRFVHDAEHIYLTKK